MGVNRTAIAVSFVSAITLVPMAASAQVPADPGAPGEPQVPATSPTPASPEGAAEPPSLVAPPSQEEPEISEFGGQAVLRASEEPPPRVELNLVGGPPPGPDGPADWSLEYGGRIFVRDTLTRVDVGGDSSWRHQRDLDQVRLNATYDREHLRIALEVDFAGDEAELKDNYIRLSPTELVRIEAGRFKVPMSFIGLESKWKLPSTERGLLSEFEQDNRDLPFAGGRGDGVSIELRPDVAVEPRFTLALFHNPLNDSTTPLDPSDHFTQDLYARLEVEPKRDLHFAAAFAWVGSNDVPGDLSSYRHHAMGSLEAAVETRYLRAWLEGFAGQSFLYQSDLSVSGSFLAARALVAGRIRKPGPLWRIEPFLGASVLDPTGDVDGDRISEILAGASVWFTKQWRLQIEAAERMAQGNAAALADSTVLRLQLGAAFEGIYGSLQ